MPEETENKGYGGYGKRPLWQWVVIYLVIGGIIYAAIYYFVLSKKGGYNYNYTAPSGQQSAPSNSTPSQNQNSPVYPQ